MFLLGWFGCVFLVFKWCFGVSVGFVRMGLFFFLVYKWCFCWVCSGNCNMFGYFVVSSELKQFLKREFDVFKRLSSFSEGSWIPKE